MIQNSLQASLITLGNNPLKKMMHPKVLKVLTQLREPSPISIPRDKTQPISGDLKRRNNLPTCMPPVERNIISSREITLALNSNALIRKRRVINNSIS